MPWTGVGTECGAGNQTDVNGNTVSATVTVVVTTTFDAWRAAKFTSAELTNAAISGAGANPDGDAYPNLLEYTLGLEPKTFDAAQFPAATISNS